MQKDWNCNNYKVIMHEIRERERERERGRVYEWADVSDFHRYIVAIRILCEIGHDTNCTYEKE